MSKIGKKLIVIPQDVQVSLAGNKITAKGSRGELTLELHPKVQVQSFDSKLKVTVKNPQDKRQKALWGTFRSLVQNIVTGVEKGFEKRLDVIGTGYKASVTGEKLLLNLGYSHPIELHIPKGLAVKVEKNSILVNGSDKQVVGEFAASIRSQREPEPYKGKGIKYAGELIRRKAGKVVKAVGG